MDTTMEDRQLVAAADLVAALGSLTDPKKDGQVNAGQRRYRYLELPDLLAEVRSTFAAHGWAIMQQADVYDGHVAVVNIWLHRSGVKLTHPPYALPSGRSPQEIGSATTYARRYSLAALVGLAGSDDDDVQSAQQITQLTKPVTRTQARPDDPANAPFQDTAAVTWKRADETPQEFAARTTKPTDKQVKYLWTLLRTLGDDNEIRAWVADQLGIGDQWHTSDLNMAQVSALIETLKALPEPPQEAP